MATEHLLPKLITFDGEARSGKGTVAHYIKRHLEESGINVKLIDRGQLFRVLVVAATQQNIDFNNTDQLDDFLSDQSQLAKTAVFIKEVYNMPHKERDNLLYTQLVGENSAKMGGRPLAQAFSIELLEKWFRDAGDEGVELILLDGRALENKAVSLEQKGLCRYIMGLYFICDPAMGARRTLGCYDTPYDKLSEQERSEVDKLVAQINARNYADQTREVQRLVRPEPAVMVTLPDVPEIEPTETRRMIIIDTSADMTKYEMCQPVLSLIPVF